MLQLGLLAAISLIATHLCSAAPIKGHLAPLGQQGSLLPVVEQYGHVLPNKILQEYLLPKTPPVMHGVAKVSIYS